MNLPNYFSHSTDGVRHFGFLPRVALQTAELNGLQNMFMGRHERVSDVQFSNGDIISGIIPRILEGDDNGNLIISEGQIYLKGDIRSLIPTIFTIPLDTRVGVGVRYTTLDVTALEDASLRDPVPGTQNYQEQGAARVIEQIAWGFLADSGASDENSTWQFFPIFVVDNGVIIMPTTSGVDRNTVELIAQYDRESHGNYVVRGFDASYTGETETHLLFNVTEGLANIYGFKVQRNTGSRLEFPKDFSTEIANFEPHVFTADISGNCKLYLNRTPIAEITQIIGVRQTNQTIVRGLAANGTDELPNNSVSEIVSVTQGATTYIENTHFVRVGDDIDWSPGGIEPAGGSSYQVTYRYLDEVTPLAVTNDYVEVTGLVAASMVQVSYLRKLPRVDLLVLTQANQLLRIKGESRLRNPAAPVAASDQIALSTITMDWVNPPFVRQIATTNVPYDRIQDMIASIGNLFSAVADLNLRVNLNNTDPSSKRDIFVDPFLDDDQRDQGAAQTCAILEGSLELAVDGDVQSLPDNNNTLHLLNYTHQVALEQTNMTEAMLINPYQSFEPLPAVVALTPQIDRWVEIVTNWKSPKTLIYSARGWGGVFNRIRTVSKSKENLEFLREIEVDFTVKGFAPGETLTLVTFDGIDVTPA